MIGELIVTILREEESLGLLFSGISEIKEN